VTDDKAGPVPAGPARESVVIRDKRKIDAEGNMRTDASGTGQSGTAQSGTAQSGTGPSGSAQSGTGPSGSAPAGADRAGPSQPGSRQPGSPTSGTSSTPDNTAGSPGQPAALAKAGRSAEPGQPAEGGQASGKSSGQPSDNADQPTGTAGSRAPSSVTVAGVPEAIGAELAALRAELDEHLRDLQRVTAEYANYRKRVERDRAVVGEQSVALVIAALLPILDDLDRAREHGDLVGPLGAMAESLASALSKFGLNAFGEPGDTFDPKRHEAVTHENSADVTEPTCVTVMRRGYLLGERLLRPALVAVADPE
jgi:molecular chaperone GrpE